MKKAMNTLLGKTLAMLAFVSVIGVGECARANTLSWNTNQHLVTANVNGVPLIQFLEGVAQLTGWQVYVESNATHTVSAAFKDLSPGEALRLSLRGLNFAMVPADPGGRPRLYVFQSSQRNATHLVRPAALKDPNAIDTSEPIADELVVTLKRGVTLESIECLRNASVIGSIAGLNTFRLKFSSADEARAARECVAGNPDVQVDSNFPVERPMPARLLDANIAPSANLKFKEPDGDCRPVIVLVDTGFGPLGKDLDPFVREPILLNGASSGTGLTHGSAMAETILRSLEAAARGNTSAQLQPVNIYGTNAMVSTFDVAQGIFEGVNAGGNIVNLSLGSSGDSAFLHGVIKAASQQGVVFFGAAGNAPVTTPFYPAAYPEVVAVTAGERSGELAGYANRGSFVDIIAPGTSVVSFGGQSYAVSGTSTATAYASGLAAGLADISRNCPGDVIPVIRERLEFKAP